VPVEATTLYLLLGITNLLGLLCAPLVERDPSALAKQIAVSEIDFRVSFVCDLFSIVLGIPLVLLLYQLLRPVDGRHAAAMVILLLVSAPMSFVLMLNDVAAHILLTDVELLSEFSKPQLDAMAILFIKGHVFGVLAVEIFWGLWLIPFGILVWKSGFLPRVLGVLLIVAGVAYAAHSLVSLLLPDFRSLLYERATMVARGAGEVPIMLWLLIKGVGSGQASSEVPRAA
jgi:hypothetical protein